MDQAVTVGAVVWFVLTAAAAVGIIGFLLWVLSVIASGYKH